MSWLTKWFIHNPVAANLLMVAIVASGVLTFGQLRVESFPQIAPSSLVIHVAYPGGSAKQIDESITQRVEESISGIAGIKQITSQSVAGLSTVRVRKTTETELDKLLEDVKNQVNAISGFPVQAEKPQVTRDEFTNLASFVIVSAPRTDSQLQPIARQVAQALKKHPKISKVSNWGSRDPIVIIEPDIEKLRSLKLNLSTLSSIIEQSSLEARTGELKSVKGRMIIRGDGYADDLQKLSVLEILSTPSGSVRLGEIATLTRDYQDSGSIVRNNGESAIALLVSTRQTDNLIQVSGAIKEVLQKERDRLPDDVSLSTMADMAPYIEDQLYRLGDNAWQGLLIVMLLLGIFLEIKLAFWVAAGIPIALCGTLSAMNLMDYSVNDITLFGFILVLGILVDDAVVVGEAIHSERGKTSNSRKAAWKGVKSVSVATVFGVLTTIAAFSPMLWINNDFAKILAGFSAVVIFALFFSLIESKFILPSHLAEMKTKNTQKSKTGIISRVQNGAQSGLAHVTEHYYRPVLQYSLQNKFASLLGFSAFFILAYGMWASGTIRSAIFPEIPGRYITAKVTLEDGSPLPLQEKALDKLERTALQLNQALQKEFALIDEPLVNLLAWSDGYGEVEVTAELSSEALSTLPSNHLTNEWRSLTGSIEGVYSSQFTAAEEPAGGTFISVSATDRELAKRVAQEVGMKLEGLPGVSDVFNDGKGGQEQVRITLNSYGRQLGLTQDKIAQLAGDAFGQREIHRLLEQGQETKVIVRYPRSERMTQTQLRYTPVMLPSGQTLPLSEIATFTVERVPEVLYRRNREQVVNVYWNQNRAVQSPEATMALLSQSIDTLHNRYPDVTIKAGGEFEEMGEVQQGFQSAMILTLLLVYILLAIPLKSYWQPLIIMAVIPFGFAGAIFGHYLMDLPISILSMFGMMAMTGIVINDSLVLITRFNSEFRNGVPLNQALITAGTSRMRAIFLTTITTVCGLLPLLSESAEQAQYLKPAAVSLVFGELFATTVTLILIPVLLGLSCKQSQGKVEPDLANQIDLQIKPTT
ncbi:efflux RND transporter permease subunit [Vibrio sp. 99-70-13A1]|uniref:efflux RND transporter permease subunit n=1 Tax=Vibrio sp. 99-70-13A1 TaxID=2607601 RepID=UPI0014932F2B|nr:efflux RND transporter permease subunit [Vibrio sp. 99-70-13A1]NOH97389.1 efflux RND transporter permease subunit [Vibrio sp. 99-70-13A1]